MLLISKERRIDTQSPVIMGVINLSQESFYEGSRFSSVQKAVDIAGAMLNDGAGILDLGAMSTRPGSEEISPKQELERLIPALTAIRSAFGSAFISADTYRASIAIEAIANGADMVNDISGGTFDPEMYETIGRLQVPYVLMHTGGKPANMQENPVYSDVVEEVALFFSSKIEALHKQNVRQIILDPGFGFGKTLEHNFRLLAGIHIFGDLGFPVLAGMSRKSMINKVLGTKPIEALNGTTILNTIALLNGADILRVHDVKEACECKKLIEAYREFGLDQKI